MYGAAILSPGVSVASIANRLLPGAHVALLGGSESSIEARRVGLMFRDTVLVLTSGPESELVPVFRKPLEGDTLVDNVVCHQSGGIHIDACRIGASTRTNSSSPGKKRNSLQKGMVGGTTTQEHTYGRWPPNLVLIHDLLCVPGIVRVEGHKGYPNGPGGSSAQFSQKGQRTTRTDAWRGHADADGKETVPAWTCAAGCPVKVLDGQSGLLSSHGGPITTGMVSMGFHGGSGSQREVIADRWTASRFFPQFADRQEFLHWLEALLLPPGTLLFR